MNTIYNMHLFPDIIVLLSELFEQVAVRDGSTLETRTFGEYDKRMRSIANALALEFNLKPDETVALLSPNNVDYVPICLAVGLVGAKVTPINPMSTLSELTKILTRSESKILFVHSKLLSVALDAARASQSVEHVIVIPDVQLDIDTQGAETLEDLASYEGLVTEHFKVKDAEHSLFLPYSSGVSRDSSFVVFVFTVMYVCIYNLTL